MQSYIFQRKESWFQHVRGLRELVGSVIAARNGTEVTAEPRVAHRDNSVHLKKNATCVLVN
jgi:hypothetical protein